MLERAARARRQLAAQIPADLGRADEAEEGDARIGCELLRERIVLGDEGLAPALFQPGLAEQGDQFQTAQRRHRRRLDDDRAADGDRGGDLVDDQIHRVIEGRDRGDDADRLLGGEGPPVLAGRRLAHRDFLAGEISQIFGGAADAVDGADHLDGRILPGFAAFARNQPGKMVLPLGQQGGGAQQYGAALMDLEPAVAIAQRARRGCELGFERLGVVGRNLRDEGPIEGLHDLDGLCHRHTPEGNGAEDSGRRSRRFRTAGYSQDRIRSILKSELRRA